MKCATLVLAALPMLLGAVGQARSGFVVDQSFQFINPSAGYGGDGIQYFSPIGEVFVPTLSSVDHVQLWVSDDNGNTSEATMHVNIRQDTIQGAILGTSSELTLPPLSQAPYEMADFTFANAISLSPGNPYVIQVVQDSGDIWYLDGRILVAGPPGNAILSGQAATSMNFFFAEGVDSPAAVPEPASLTLLGIGAAGLGVIRLRRRKPTSS